MIRTIPSPILNPVAAFTRSSLSLALFLAGDFGNQSGWNPLGSSAAGRPVRTMDCTSGIASRLRHIGRRAILQDAGPDGHADPTFVVAKEIVLHPDTVAAIIVSCDLSASPKNERDDWRSRSP
jgi:hypothetical protein